MSIFPDRSIVSATTREIALSDQGLTDLQKKQLSGITENYLKTFGLIGYENTVAVIPVIRQCVVNGLQIIHKRDQILPTDSLTSAFKKGYEERNKLFRVADAEIVNLNTGSRFQGAFAIPQELILSTSQELSRKAFIVDPKSTKSLVEMINTRKPIYQQIVRYCRDRVEEVIPGSKDISLDDKQQTALVRHLVFSHLALGEIKILLETEDFMSNRQTYLTQIPQTDMQIWHNLAKQIGLDNKETIEYLIDISKQVGDFLVSVPNQPAPKATTLEVASAISTAYKRLENHFLVVNPFNKFQSLSENPGDKGSSIWDDERTNLVVINGVKYRIPTVATLNLASYLISGQNPERSQQLSLSSRYVEGLLADIADKNTNLRISELQAEINEQKTQLETSKASIITEHIPSGLRMSHSSVLELALNQKDVMRDEINFFNHSRARHQRLTDIGLQLLLKYKDGNSEQNPYWLRRLQKLYVNPTILGVQVRYFMRERISRRVKVFEDMSNYSHIMGVYTENLPDHLKGNLEPLNTTIIDILGFRNRFWIFHHLNVLLSEIDQKDFNFWRNHGENIIRNSVANWTHTRKLRSSLNSGWGKLSDYSDYKNDDLTDNPNEELEVKAIKERSENPFGPASLILYSLVRLAPKELWPSYPVSIHDVSHSNYHQDETSPLIYIRPGREGVEERNQKVYRLFQEWLAKEGFPFNDDTYKMLIPPNLMSSLVNNGHAYHRFFSIEDEAKQWYSNLESRLAEQVAREKGQYFINTPTYFINNLTQILEQKEVILRRIKKDIERRLNSKVTALQNLGLILEEKE